MSDILSELIRSSFEEVPVYKRPKVRVAAGIVLAVIIGLVVCKHFAGPTYSEADIQQQGLKAKQGMEAWYKAHPPITKYNNVGGMKTSSTLK